MNNKIQSVNGLKFLWCHSMIHRDLKPENILISGYFKNKVPFLKIADFGFAQEIEGEQLTRRCGTPLYMVYKYYILINFNFNFNLLIILIYHCLKFNGFNHILILIQILKIKN